MRGVSVLLYRTGVFVLYCMQRGWFAALVVCCAGVLLQSLICELLFVDCDFAAVVDGGGLLPLTIVELLPSSLRKYSERSLFDPLTDGP